MYGIRTLCYLLGRCYHITRETLSKITMIKGQDALSRSELVLGTYDPSITLFSYFLTLIMSYVCTVVWPHVSSLCCFSYYCSVTCSYDRM